MLKHFKSHEINYFRNNLQFLYDDFNKNYIFSAWYRFFFLKKIKVKFYAAWDKYLSEFENIHAHALCSMFIPWLELY